jgi:Zn finger protein HypA/HybF involved in hydrogenase expression
MDEKIKRGRLILENNEEKCRRCEGILYRGTPLINEDKLTPETIPDTVPCDMVPRLDLKSNGVDRFSECPHCGAKNIVIIESPKEGLPQLKIVSWK